MAADILAELASTQQNWLDALNSFNQEQFNTVPFEDSWTAGQVAEHVYKSIAHVPQLIDGNTLPTERDPAKNVPGIRNLFLDFSSKLKSPDFILPSDKPKDLEQMTQALDEVFTEIIAAAKGIDLTLTIAGFEFPGSGPLTRLELLNFISVHTQRHTHQLQQIRKSL